MFKFCFVILHYLLEKETIQCVDSILDLKENNVEIVIVDNASPNNSGIKIKEHFAGNKRVHVIINESNLGFSKGNNIGYKFAKNQLGADFIILCNNDIIVDDKEIVSKAVDDYQEYAFAVLGPHIINLNIGEKNQNPAYDVMKDKRQMEKSLKRTVFLSKTAVFLSYIGLDERFLGLKNRLKEYKDTKSEENVPENVEINVGLHGCFWVFSPKFIKRFDGLQEITFMYFEEWLLYSFCKDNNLTMIYDRRISITHIGNAATNRTCKKARDSKKMHYKRIYEAAKDVLCYIDGRKGEQKVNA